MLGRKTGASQPERPFRSEKQHRDFRREETGSLSTARPPPPRLTRCHGNHPQASRLREPWGWLVPPGAPGVLWLAGVEGWI